MTATARENHVTRAQRLESLFFLLPIKRSSDPNSYVIVFLTANYLCHSIVYFFSKLFTQNIILIYFINFLNHSNNKIYI